MATEREQILDLTKKLIEIPSVTGRTTEAEKVLKLVDNYLSFPGVVSKHYQAINLESDDKHEVVSQLWGAGDSLKKPKLLLCGHIDVVKAASEQFAPSMDSEGRLHARGAGDMKGHAASMIYAYRKWIEEMGSPNGVALLLTSDEEEGGFYGARHVIEQDGLRPSIVFIPDGEFNFDIVDSQKAPHHFHVRAVSEDGGGHVSLAFKLDNPVNRILRVCEQMRKKYNVESDDDWRSTFEMTVFKTGNGGLKNNQDKVENGANQIAEWAEAWLGWRWPLEVAIDGKKATYDSGLTDLQRIAGEQGVEIMTDGHGLGEGCYTDPKADFVQKWKGIIEPIIGKKVGFQHMHGATDGRHFYKYGSQVLVTSAITGGAHSNNEWVDIDSLVKLAQAVYTYQQEITK